MRNSLSVVFVITGAFFLGYAITAGVLTEFTISRVVLCCTSTACMLMNARNLI
jgi:hypothetical protein